MEHDESMTVDMLKAILAQDKITEEAKHRILLYSKTKRKINGNIAKL